MTIALLAHDAKKELMADFCTAYSGILNRHHIIATATTANVVRDATGLTIQSLLSGNLGGSQQVCSLIACGEVDMVILFSDPSASRLHNPDYHNIIRLCDMYTVPVATNIASAELLIRGLGRGDLDWREIGIHPDEEPRVS
jgi:methylglyoxal synthase